MGNRKTSGCRELFEIELPWMIRTFLYREEWDAGNIKWKKIENICLAVNMDSELLLQQIDECKIDYITIEREEELAGDMIAKKDVINDTLQKCEKRKKMQFDVVIDLDLTFPLRTVDDVIGTLEILLEDKEADIAYSVTEARRSPYFNTVMQNEHGYYETVIKSDFVARQQAPVCYDMNVCIYAYRRAYLLDSRIVNRKELIWIMKDTNVLDIDSEKDFELMEVIAGYFEKRDK